MHPYSSVMTNCASTTITEKNTEDFNAEKFVEILLNEGAKAPCDETVKTFYENEVVPPFYDEDMYKRGQKFFNHHIFALFFGKFLGLLSVLAIPSIVRILIYTKMSGTPMTAYKRYMSTIFHMCVWYDSDFKPGSKLWQSIFEVKNKHNSVSKRCCEGGLGRISQKDMAFTQFGFMGYALAKREKVGLHNVKDEDWQAFIHVWRVIGYVMGIEDRFNICRDSVKETTEICRVLSDQVFKPAVERKDKDFIEMATYLTKGMWSMNPTLEITVYLNLLHNLLQTPYNNNNIHNNNIATKEEYIPLSFLQKIYLNILIFVVWTLQFNMWRIFHNNQQHLALWLMKVFPFLAYYQFGYANSHVKLSFENNNKKD